MEKEMDGMVYDFYKVDGKEIELIDMGS